MNKHKGSTFDSFLEEEGLLENLEAAAIKRVISYQLEQSMKKKHINKRELANKMHTSRSSLDRLLDPNNTSVFNGVYAVGSTYAGGGITDSAGARMDGAGGWFRSYGTS